MATAQNFIESALRKIKVKGAETPLTATELADGLEVLNDMGAELEAEGFELGFTELLLLSDTVTIPAYANNFYRLQLGGRLAPEYLDGQIPAFLPELITGARRIVIRELNRKSVGTTGTYQNLVYGAFELSGVKDGSEPIALSELQNAIPRLNDIITEQESKGFRLGYQISSGADLTLEHGLPDWSWAWLKAKLANRLSTSYSVQPNQVAVQMEQEGDAAAYQRFAQPITVYFPDTLPTGSDYGYGAFYGDEISDDLLTGTGNPLLDDEGNPLEISE